MQYNIGDKAIPPKVKEAIKNAAHDLAEKHWDESQSVAGDPNDLRERTKAYESMEKFKSRVHVDMGIEGEGGYQPHTENNF